MGAGTREWNEGQWENSRLKKLVADQALDIYMLKELPTPLKPLTRSQIARRHTRWGWRTAHTLLRWEGWVINKKRTRRA